MLNNIYEETFKHDNAIKNFNILAIRLSIWYNYLDGPITLDLYIQLNF